MDFLEQMVTAAQAQLASDLHLEPSLPPTIRVSGQLKPIAEPVSAHELMNLARGVVGEDNWATFCEERSHDAAKTIAGVRCRINAMCTMRGIGLAIRLLPAVLPTVSSLNLHPDLTKLVANPHGLILLCGPTGSGKSSTMAALLQEINQNEPRHIVTIEHPVEYALRPKKAFVRQREVGRDTPSYEAALRDALREDPDVIMVGEMRRPQTMRLTLDAAETGHLVLATLHSSSVAEALQRLVMAFPAETQSSIASQLADCLLAGICQRLVFWDSAGLRVPECEIVLSTTGSRAVIRQQEFFKLASIVETSGNEGMWTRVRYQRWLESRTSWQQPTRTEPSAAATDGAQYAPLPKMPPLQQRIEKKRVRSQERPQQKASGPQRRSKGAAAGSASDENGVIVIESSDSDAAEILRELERTKPKR